MSEASNNPKSNIRLISERRSLDGTELTLSLLWWFNTLARFTVLWLSQTRTNRLRYTLWLLCNDFISIGIFLSWLCDGVWSGAVGWGFHKWRHFNKAAPSAHESEKSVIAPHRLVLSQRRKRLDGDGKMVFYIYISTGDEVRTRTGMDDGVGNEAPRF